MVGVDEKLQKTDQRPFLIIFWHFCFPSLPKIFVISGKFPPFSNGFSSHNISKTWGNLASSVISPPPPSLFPVIFLAGFWGVQYLGVCSINYFWFSRTFKPEIPFFLFESKCSLWFLNRLKKSKKVKDQTDTKLELSPKFSKNVILFGQEVPIS